MKIIEPKVEIWEQEPGINGIYKQIERAGRVCYKSENHITEDSAKPFVERMIKSEHYAMLEHGTVYLSIPTLKNEDLTQELFRSKFTHWCKPFGAHCINFSTNLRVLVEKDMWDICKPYVCDFDKRFFYGDRRVTVHFTTQIAVSREANRHRVDSVAEQSTRFCNYSKDKFGSEIAINKPSWIVADNFVHSLSYDPMIMLDPVEVWWCANAYAEACYMRLLQLGWKPEQARVVLPLDTNTELVHTAFVSDWMHFFDLRALNKTGKAHPDMIKVAKPLYEEFKRRGYIK
jgi:thymidylate synthase (FAD)